MMITAALVNGGNIEYGEYHTEYEDDMTVDHEWQARVKGMLRAELKRRNMGYRELAEKLTAMGVPESERNIANKISRGGFTAVFFVQCLVAAGCRSLLISDVD